MKLPICDIYVLVGYYGDGSLNPNEIFGVFINSEEAHRLKGLIEVSNPRMSLEVVESLYWE